MINLTLTPNQVDSILQGLRMHSDVSRQLASAIEQESLTQIKALREQQEAKQNEEASQEGESSVEEVE